MRVLAEIPAAGPAPLRPGTLRRCDQEAFGLLLGQLGEARSVLVTGERDRKRAVAVGLAAAAAAAGTRTALLECDLGEPSLADALGLATAPGLVEHLRGEVGAGQTLSALALAGPGSAAAREPLACVVAGRPTAEGSTLLSSPAFPRAAAGLRAAYELLVVDGPPAAARDGSLEAVAAQADATLLCVGRPGAAELPVPVTGLVVQP